MALPIEFITRTRALLGEEYDKMIRSFREADLPPEEFAEYVVAKAEECKARLKERWG